MVDMSKMRGKGGADEIDKWVEQITDIGEANGISGGIELDDYDEEFIDNIENQLSEGRRLTPRQIEHLDSIWARI